MKDNQHGADHYSASIKVPHSGFLDDSKGGHIRISGLFHDRFRRGGHWVVGWNSNVYFADGSQTVYKVDPRGVLTRAAGNGHPGFSGDGGPAVNAQLNYVSGLAVDNSGNLFIVCQLGGLILNNTGVRKVSPEGIISTVAGGGDQIRVDGRPALSVSTAAQGIAVDSAGNLYITDNLNNCICKITTDGIIHVIGGSGTTGYTGDGGAARNAALSPNPLNGIAVDGAGNVYLVVTRSDVSGSLGDCVRKISTSGIITTVAGGCAAKLSGLPFVDAFSNLTGIAIDSAGLIFVGDSSRIVEISRGVTTFAGATQTGSSGDGGSGAGGVLGSVGAVAVDNTGNVYTVGRRIGRLLPPYLTRLQQRYSAYLQRPGLTKIPKTLLPLPVAPATVPAPVAPAQAVPVAPTPGRDTVAPLKAKVVPVEGVKPEAATPIAAPTAPVPPETKEPFSKVGAEAPPAAMLEKAPEEGEPTE